MENCIAQTDQSIFSDVVAILNDMTSDWDTDYDEPISADTRLIADLEFESIDVVQLIVAIEEHYKNSSLPFERLLMKDDRYVDEIVVGDVVGFLGKHLGQAA